MTSSIFDQIDFGPLNEFLNDDNVTDISYSNGGQVWLKTLTDGVYKVERPDINNPMMEKLAFQCSNVMGKTFNMAHPFLDSESAELRMNFIHESIATNGIACVIRKTPAKIRLNKEKLISEEYMTEKLHNFLEQCVLGHCNIIVSGETGSGKTELVKYLASKTRENEKIISIEDTLELHLDRIYPNRDIVAMKTNNIASYSDVLVTCMRQNPIWILLSEVRSAEAVLAVRNSISSGHHILSTIHADKASSIPMRMYSLLESSQDIEQFLSSIHRYVQIGIYVKGYFSKKLNRFQREIIEVCEFYVDDDNVARSNNLYKKTLDGVVTMNNPTHHLLDYLSIGNVFLPEDTFGLESDNNEEVIDYSKTEEVNNMLNSNLNATLEESKVETLENITGDIPNETLDLNDNLQNSTTNNMEATQVENLNIDPILNPVVTPNTTSVTQIEESSEANPSSSVTLNNPNPVNEISGSNLNDNSNISIDNTISETNNSNVNFNAGINNNLNIEPSDSINNANIDSAPIINEAEQSVVNAQVNPETNIVFNPESNANKNQVSNDSNSNVIGDVSVSTVNSNIEMPQMNDTIDSQNDLDNNQVANNILENNVIDLNNLGSLDNIDVVPPMQPISEDEK